MHIMVTLLLKRLPEYTVASTWLAPASTAALQRSASVHQHMPWVPRSSVQVANTRSLSGQVERQESRVMARTECSDKQPSDINGSCLTDGPADPGLSTMSCSLAGPGQEQRSCPKRSARPLVAMAGSSRSV
jgi:hypothetical protein